MFHVICSSVFHIDRKQAGINGSMVFPFSLHSNEWTEEMLQSQIPSHHCWALKGSQWGNSTIVQLQSVVFIYSTSILCRSSTSQPLYSSLFIKIFMDLGMVYARWIWQEPNFGGWTNGSASPEQQLLWGDPRIKISLRKENQWAHRVPFYKLLRKFIGICTHSASRLTV